MRTVRTGAPLKNHCTGAQKQRSVWVYIYHISEDRNSVYCTWGLFHMAPALALDG